MPHVRKKDKKMEKRVIKKYHLKKEVKEIVLNELLSLGSFLLFATMYILFA